MSPLSDLLKAWYAFLALCLLTFVLTAFVGTPPAVISSAVALPHNLLFRASFNLRETLISIVERRDFRTEISTLRSEIAELEAQRRRLEDNVERYRSLLRVSIYQSPAVVGTAPVVGITSSNVTSRMTIGEGRANGVIRNMPVTAIGGLVGIVTEMTEHTAVVRTVLDPESRIGVTVRGRGGQGIAVGELGSLIRVKNFSVGDPIQIGDYVETSSRGGLFPRGITVGEIIYIEPRGANSLRTEFLVRPLIEMQNLLEVALIDPL